MTDKAECPYCGCEARIDDGPYGDDETLEYKCSECDKPFNVTSTLHITYEVSCADGEHDYQPSPYDSTEGYFFCSRCQKIRVEP
jgi:hypothetical protein